MIERRRFSRIVYQAQAVITQETTQVDASVNDLSLHRSVGFKQSS